MTTVCPPFTRTRRAPHVFGKGSIGASAPTMRAVGSDRTASPGANQPENT